MLALKAAGLVLAILAGLLIVSSMLGALIARRSGPGYVHPDAPEYRDE